MQYSDGRFIEIHEEIDVGEGFGEEDEEGEWEDFETSVEENIETYVEENDSSNDSHCTKVVESTQPLQQLNPFDPQRRVQEEVPTNVVLETSASNADIQVESPSDEDTPVATPQQRQGWGQAKLVQMPTDGMKIPLGLDEYGGLPQQQTYEWDPTIHKTVEDLWNVTARIKFKHALSELKAKCAKRNFQVNPLYMNPKLWTRLVYLWAEDEGHLRRSSSTKGNRAKGPRVTHTNGSMDVNVYRKKMGRLSTFLEVYTSRRQRKRKGKDQVPVYCNDEAQEIAEKLTAEYVAKKEQEGWLKGLDIHTHSHDIGFTTILSRVIVNNFRHRIDDSGVPRDCSVDVYAIGFCKNGFGAREDGDVLK
ncbi:hypothetical protein SLEP1_g55059 [Rubroshorea leprosula]|uniref:Transposase n=1 Tax=Rubroshorea leprosula TaxID=152421 RepID=A0AAV5MGT5_9ROSI|nr:hypothetical protein SLEP1_g55059 [Rubroshorea leprosula]